MTHIQDRSTIACRALRDASSNFGRWCCRLETWSRTPIHWGCQSCRAVSLRVGIYDQALKLTASRTLRTVEKQFQSWARYGKVERIILSQRISSEMSTCHTQISQCLQALGVSARAYNAIRTMLRLWLVRCRSWFKGLATTNRTGTSKRSRRDHI